MNTKTKKIALLLPGMLLYGALFFQIAFAQQSVSPTPTYSGAEATIKQYLCTPTTTNTGTTLSATTASNTGQNNPASNDLYNCINRMYRFAIVAASALAVFFIVIAGYVYMSADGDGEAVTKAKGILASSLASLVILFAGYIILRALNPDLIQFQNVLPPSVKMTTALPPEPWYGEPPANEIPAVGRATSTLPGAAGVTIAQLQQAGCDITSEQRPKTELPNITSSMWNVLKQICETSSQGGVRPIVTSTVRRESTGSYHQKGCAIDFADGKGDGFFNIVTLQGRSAGVAIYNAATKSGIAPARINPGTDRAQTYHIHVDLGNTCSN